MRGMTAALVGLGLGFASPVLGAGQAGEAAPPPETETVVMPAPEKPRGVCHFNKPGISLTVEDTTQEACHDRQVQCQQDNPGHEAECRSRWTPAEEKEKAKPARKAKKAAARADQAPAQK